MKKGIIEKEPMCLDCKYSCQSRCRIGQTNYELVALNYCKYYKCNIDTNTRLDNCDDFIKGQTNTQIIRLTADEMTRLDGSLEIQSK